MIGREIVLSLMFVCGLTVCTEPVSATLVNTSQYLSYVPGAQEAALEALTAAANAEADVAEAITDLALMTQNFGKYYDISGTLTSPVIASRGAYLDAYNSIIADYDSDMEPINEAIDEQFDELVNAIQNGNWYNVMIASENLYEQFWYAWGTAVYYRGLVGEVRDNIRADCLNHPDGPLTTEGDPEY